MKRVLFSLGILFLLYGGIQVQAEELENEPIENIESESAYNEDSIDYQVGDVTITPVATNPDYSSMEFTYTSNGEEYTCFITGLEVDENNTSDSYQNLANAIALAQLKGETFELNNETVSQYGLKLDMIDAEKEEAYQESDDDLLCWAASGADAIEFTGWSQNDEDEDGVFGHLRESFTDNGGFQEDAFTWYLDGIYYNQDTDENGDPVFYNDNSDGSQQKRSGTGGYVSDYFADSFFEAYDFEENHEQEYLHKITDALQQNAAVALGIYFFIPSQDWKYAGGHAVTLFGYIEKGDEIVSIFIADSDNTADSESTSRENRPNIYTMYPIGYRDGYPSIENYVSPYYASLIGSACIIQPFKEVEDQVDVKGSHKPYENVDLYLTDLYTSLEQQNLTQTNVNELLSLYASISNYSYIRLSEGSNINYTYTINGPVTTSLSNTFTLTEALPYLKELLIDNLFSFTNPGLYSLYMTIDSIQDALGNELQEAYLINNFYASSYTILVNGDVGYTVNYVDEMNHVIQSQTYYAPYNSYVSVNDFIQNLIGYTYAYDSGDLYIDALLQDNVMTIFYHRIITPEHSSNKDTVQKQLLNSSYHEVVPTGIHIQSTVLTMMVSLLGMIVLRKLKG